MTNHPRQIKWNKRIRVKDVLNATRIIAPVGSELTPISKVYVFGDVTVQHFEDENGYVYSYSSGKEGWKLISAPPEVHEQESIRFIQGEIEKIR